MTSLLGDAYVRIRPDVTGFRQEAESGIGAAMSKVAKAAAVAFAAAGVASFGKDLINMSSAAQQSVGAVQSVFKTYADTVTKRSKDADRALGLSANSYRTLATVMGAQLKNAGVPLDELSNKTDGMIRMGADLAAQFGGTTQEAVEALSAAFRGEYDPIEKYGISLNETALKAQAMKMGLDTSGTSLSTNTRIMASMALVTQQGADAVGQFARENDTAAGRAQRAGAQWDNLKTAIGDRLLPLWSGLMDFVGTRVIPGLEKVGGYIQTNVVPAFKDVSHWVADNSAWLVPLAAGIGAVAVAWGSYQTALSIASGVTKAFAAVQAVLNAVMAANPLGIVVLALVGLGTALFVAYQKSETFRDIVNGAFSAVATAGKWLWENALKPAFDGIMAGWHALSTGIGWAWDHILSPVWEVLKVAAQVLFAVLVVGTFGPIYAAWFALTNGIKLAWEGILKPAWDALSVAAQWMWNNFLSPVFGAIGAGWDVLLRGIDLAWNNILKPAWNLLQLAAQVMWVTFLSPIFSAIGAGWDGLMRGIRFVYDNVVHPMWKVLSDAVGAVSGVFDTAVSAVGTAWDKIKAVAAKPIHFVLETILKNGLFRAWDAVVGTVGLDGLKIGNAQWLTDAIAVTNLATGGRVPGYSPNDKADNIPAMLTANEYVQPVAAHEYYGTGVMDAIRQRKIPREAFQHLADGGPVYQQLFDRVKQQFPRARMNSSFRPGDPGLHGKGLAVDLGEEGFSGGDGRPYLAQMNQWLYDNFKSGILELIYDGAGDSRPDIKNGADHAYNAATRSGHHNHVHLAAASLAAMLGGKGGGGGGGGGSVLDLLGQLTDSITNPVKKLGEMFGGSPFVQAAAAAPGKLLSHMWSAIKDRAAAFFESFVLTGQDREVGDTGGIKSDVSAVLQNRGWQMGTPFWAGTDFIFSHESNWNPKAQNPNGSASGLAQMIDSTWRANRPISAGSIQHMKDARVVEQAQAYGKYIAGRFGDPLKAMAYWKQHHSYADGGKVAKIGLYDNGGILGHGNIAVNQSGHDERVLNPRETRAYEAGMRGSGGDITLNVTVDPSKGHVRDQVDEAMFQMRRLSRGGVHRGR